MEVESQRRLRRKRFDSHRGHQPIAVAVHGLDQRLGIVLEDFANAADTLGQHRFTENAAGPHRLFEFFLGHHFAGVMQQMPQHFQRLAVQVHHAAVECEFETAFVEDGATDKPALADCARYRLVRLHWRHRLHDCATPAVSPKFRLLPPRSLYM